MKIGFIGGGNMGSALIGGLRASGFDGTIAVADPTAAKRESLAARFAVEGHEAGGAWLEDMDLVVLAVKPQVMKEVLAPISQWLGKSAVLSIAAGIPMAALERWTGSTRIVRAMPNTPAMVGAGMTGLFAGEGTSQKDREMAELVAKAAGEVVWVESEDRIDVVVGISGSGPAYVFHFIEALEAAAIARGVAPALARKMAVMTLYGSAKLAYESGEDPAQLRVNVTSKGGTTARGLAAMDERDFMGLVDAAVGAAQARSAEMSTLFGAE